MEGAIAGGRERSQMKRSNHRWKVVTRGGDELKQESCQSRGAIRGGGEPERSEVKGSHQRWRGAIRGGGEQK